MKKFEALECIIMSKPVIEMENPFYLTFDVKVQDKVIPATFIGNFARMLKSNICIDKRAIIRNALITDDGKLVFDYMHIEPNAAIGRNINTMA